MGLCLATIGQFLLADHLFPWATIYCSFGSNHFIGGAGHHYDGTFHPHQPDRHVFADSVPVMVAFATYLNIGVAILN